MLVGTLLLIVGPRAAEALNRAHASASTPALSRVSAVETPTPAASAKPSAAPSPAVAKPIRVVGLGDSVPAGDQCDCTSYVSLVAEQQAALLKTSAVVSNLAEGGLSTAGLNTQLEDSSVRQQVANADVVIITIGANDFDTDSVADSSCSGPDLSCFQSVLGQQAAQLGSVYKTVSGLVGTGSTKVLVTGYWNVFLDGDVAAAQGNDYIRNSVSLTVAENALIASTAQAQGATYVDIFTPFKGQSGANDDTNLLADDGDHPNAAGHRTIAKALESTLTAA